MRLVDETLILQNLECLQKSPWYNDGKDPESGRRWQFNIRKEATEIVRDLCVIPVPTVDAIPVEWLNERHRKCCEDVDTDLMDAITVLCNEYHVWQKEQGAR